MVIEELAKLPKKLISNQSDAGNILLCSRFINITLM
jgi:hypothetical protein